MKKRTKIWIGIGAIVLIGVIVTAILLYLKNKRIESEWDESININNSPNPGQSNPSYGYSKIEIQSMQRTMLTMAKDNWMIDVINDINKHGGVDGVIGPAFHRSVEALKKKGLIKSLEDLHDIATRLPNNYGTYPS